MIVGDVMICLYQRKFLAMVTCFTLKKNEERTADMTVHGI